MRPRVNRWLDLIDRAGWTAVQASSGAALTFIALGGFTWGRFGAFVGVTTSIAVLKVLAGQSTGEDETGSLIGAPVIEPAPAIEDSGPER